MNRCQAGFGLIVMVMVLAMISVLTMTALNTQLAQQHKINHQQRYYLSAYNQAQSDLHWAMQQHWPEPTAEWFCLIADNQSYQACVRRLAQSTEVIVKSGVYRQTIAFYRLASAIEMLSDQPASGYKLTPLDSGWLDYCPESPC